MFILIGSGSTTIRFQNAELLLEVKEHPQFSVMLSTVKCLIALVDTYVDDEVSQLIDMVNKLEVESKYLIFMVMVPSLNATLLQNKTINYNVAVAYRGAGTKIDKILKFLENYFIVIRWPHHNFSLSSFGEEIWTTRKWFVPKTCTKTRRKETQHFFHWS